MNIAHYLTFLRIIIIPFFPLIYLYPFFFSIPEKIVPIFLLIILLICELSDLIDGILARKKNQVTDVGKIIDPMADVITHISVFLTFTQKMVSLPLMLVFILLYRELIISALRTICALRGFALAARKSGKIKAFLQACLSFFIVILLFFYNYGLISLNALRNTSLFALIIVVLYSVFTALEYFYANRKFFKKLSEK